MHPGVAFFSASVDTALAHSRAGIPDPHGVVFSMLGRENSPAMETCMSCLLSAHTVPKGQLAEVRLCEPGLRKTSYHFPYEYQGGIASTLPPLLLTFGKLSFYLNFTVFLQRCA